MKILLDTHLVVWLSQEPERVPQEIRAAVQEADERFVGAPSAYEIAFKAQLGKLPRGQVLIDNWTRVLSALLAEELTLTSGHMARAGGLRWEHRDPFDRMLVAQAQRDGLILVTADRRIRDFADVRTMW